MHPSWKIANATTADSLRVYSKANVTIDGVDEATSVQGKAIQGLYLIPHECGY